MINALLLAQKSINPVGPTFDDPNQALGIILGGAFKFILIIAGFFALIQIILAGYAMISSEGQKEALSSAQSRILWAIIGIIVVALSWGIITLVQSMMGICLGFGCDAQL